ncbi:MAG: NAD(P)-binding protein [Alphaproteobacteria bacterium]|nr:NAD(P)-binding protein [Alphaproteobacteria bacterium]
MAAGRMDCDVAVVGGGMAGLTLGCALAGAGVRVRVLEPQPVSAQTDPGFDGRTTAIAAGSRAVLEAVGAWPAMAADAQPILDIRVSDGHSPLFLHYDHRALGDGPMGHIVENRAIRRALADRLAALDPGALVEGVRIAAAERGARRAVLHAADGGQTSCRLVVAADGRRSAMRQEAGIRTAEWRYRQTGIVCTVEHARDHGGAAQERFLPAGPFAILPMTGRRSSIVWTERDDIAPAILALDEAGFAEELGLRFGDYLGDLRVVGPVFSYPLGLLHAETYVAARLALIGDAAHAIHPIAGQGLNIGLRDVAALAEVTVDTMRLGLDPGGAVALDRYERWRRPDNATMLAVTDGLNRLFSNDLAPLRTLRDAGLAAVNRAAPLKRLFMRHAMGLVGDLPRMIRGEAL